MGIVGGVPSLITPDKRQGWLLEEVIPMSFRIFLIRLYQ